MGALGGPHKASNIAKLVAEGGESENIDERIEKSQMYEEMFNPVVSPFMLEPIIVVRKRALDDLHSMLQQGQVPAQEELEAMFTLLGHPLSCKVSYIYAKGF